VPRLGRPHGNMCRRPCPCRVRPFPTLPCLSLFAHIPSLVVARNCAARGIEALKGSAVGEIEISTPSSFPSTASPSSLAHRPPSLSSPHTLALVAQWDRVRMWVRPISTVQRCAKRSLCRGRRHYHRWRRPVAKGPSLPLPPPPTPLLPFHGPSAQMF